MPSVSKRPENFFRAVAHSKEFADKAGVPQKGGQDFNDADKKKSRSDRLYKKVK